MRKEIAVIIQNANIFNQEGKFEKGSIVIVADKIEQIIYDREAGLKERVVNIPYEDRKKVFDAEGLYVIPGLVDIHFHGCNGYDFCDGTEAAFEGIEEYQLQYGVTSICPATMTLPKEELLRICTAAKEYISRKNSAIRGITMEGPFLSQAKKGAQNSKYLHKPDRAFYREIQDMSGGLLKQVVVAPEEDTNLQFVKEVSEEVVVSLGHTTADYALACKAFEAGAKHVTHLFNAMSPFLHREPAVVGAALEQKDVFVELICDGIHVHPAMVRAMFQLFGAERICMISDSMSATGMPDGTYALGGQVVTVSNKVATLEDGTIAASVSNLYDCLKKTVLEMQVPLESAVLACTSTPARSLGLEQECGSIEEGRWADLLFLDGDLNIIKVLYRGSEIR